MTGAEHYSEAERLMSLVSDDDGTTPMEKDESGWRARTIAQAQVHATLALTAATAYAAVKDYLGDEGSESRDWTRATAPSREPVSS